MAWDGAQPYILAMEGTTMADAFESLAPGDVVVTRPKPQQDHPKALGDGWAPMLLLSNFRDDAGRRWAVAVPLEPTVGHRAIGLDNIPQAAANGSLRTPLRNRMEPNIEGYAFLPLFQGPAPFLKNPGNDSLAWGQTTDPFTVRDVHKDVVDAHGRGLMGYRVGVREDSAQRTAAPVRVHTGAAHAHAGKIHTVQAHATQESHNDLAPMLPTPLRQALALGAAKAEAHMASVPRATLSARQNGPLSYGVPVVSKPTVSLTL